MDFSHIMNQDFIAWVGQGTVSDRSREHLGASDRGISLIRRKFFADLDAISRGEDPKTIVRDRELNSCVRLPIADREIFMKGLPRKRFAEFNRERFRMFGAYTYQKGQAEPVKQRRPSA